MGPAPWPPPPQAILPTYYCKACFPAVRRGSQAPSLGHSVRACYLETSGKLGACMCNFPMNTSSSAPTAKLNRLDGKATGLNIYRPDPHLFIPSLSQCLGCHHSQFCEIIKFPILKLNGQTMEIESTFHMCVQPIVHPQLTPFCTETMGSLIIQAMVDGQPSLQQVLERVNEWMAKEGLLDPNMKSIFVTCGDWDLNVMLPGQCQYLGLPVAGYFKQWNNLKKAYSFAMGCWPKNGLLDMNKGLGLQHIGGPHSGTEIGFFVHH
ncbi:hypothetical protein FD754_003396 [Muntiacus muntjak]|uniref:Exonuclease domain-containing protein n=1 Tax=Muntiacus muntjak TaxID=9888 RepID=A0A5N3WBZ4_MUNMU|nr:hypothetical protein FD754_003396 [Muntiacus muntjak]